MIDIGTLGVCTDSPVPEGFLGGGEEEGGGVRRKRRLRQGRALREGGEGKRKEGGRKGIEVMFGKRRLIQRG